MTRREWICSILAAASIEPAILTGQDTQQSWKPLFLTADQNNRLVSLGELIIPGSTSASCNRVIDLILSIESQANQQTFLHALAAFPADSAAQKEMLQRASQAQSPMHAHFQIIKEWIADTYWSSQQGLRELGSTGRMAWEKFDACEHTA
ncbi:MAG TPA: hypothetical protein VFA65_18035 [Bryobacteraceae bacterium]|nr:hypothetical protein [Bryobacteraceae bacterium]